MAAGVRDAERKLQLQNSMKQLLQSKAGKVKEKPSKDSGYMSNAREDRSDAVQQNEEDRSDAVQQNEEDRSDAAQQNEEDRSDAAQQNEDFFRQLEKDYGQMCAKDGWDEVLRAASDPPPAKVLAEEIPADSDYHRAGQGASRELRFDRERGRQLLQQLPAKPRRNLDALRRVEAETREAIEKEMQRRAELPKTEPIRTKSEVVHLDTLDSEDWPSIRPDRFESRKLRGSAAEAYD
ncbi:unnamed protein product [Effrenium voratum]|nr:unnamed protein product [Effrenium voratum]